jgi:hypothetical protein
VTIVRPPAGNRASKLVDLEPFPVVLEPEGFFVPLAVSFAVLEALSPLLLLSLLLLSPVAVGFAAADVFAGCVLAGASEEALSLLSLLLSKPFHQYLGHSITSLIDILLSWRPRSTFLTSVNPEMLSNACFTFMAWVTDDMATTAARI